MASSDDSNPSRINNGWLGSSANSSRVLIKLDLPRISISGMWFGSLPNSTLSSTLNAGSKVFRLAITFCVPIFCRSFPVKVDDAPVKLSFRLFTIPVTATSLRLVFDSRRILIFRPRCIFTVCGSMPTYDTIMFFTAASTASVKFPSASVVVPFAFASLACIVAPIKGSPCSSTTTPFTTWVCAIAVMLIIAITAIAISLVICAPIFCIIIPCLVYFAF